jgi:nucleotide-binding universal stress UspA family protein
MKPHILVPYDFSPASAKALAWAADLQRSLDGVPVHVIHVVDPLPATAPEMLLAVLSERDLKAMADALTRAVRDRGLAATTEVILAPASGHVIVEVARQRNANLIAMGTHGRGGLSRLVLGSVAEFVVRHAPCPVVTIRAEPADAAQAA